MGPMVQALLVLKQSIACAEAVNRALKKNCWMSFQSLME
jgi:hypothetical protein